MADAASGQGNESDGFRYQGEKPGSRYRVEAYVCNRGLKDGLRSDAQGDPPGLKCTIRMVRGL